MLLVIVDRAAEVLAPLFLRLAAALVALARLAELEADLTSPEPYPLSLAI
jgi:hypothetical protein